MSPVGLPLHLNEDVVVVVVVEAAEVAAAWTIGQVSTKDTMITPGMATQSPRTMETLKSCPPLMPRKTRSLAAATGIKERRSVQQTALVHANFVKGAVGTGKVHTGTIVPDAALHTARCS